MATWDHSQLSLDQHQNGWQKLSPVAQKAIVVPSTCHKSLQEVDFWLSGITALLVEQCIFLNYSKGLWGGHRRCLQTLALCQMSKQFMTTWLWFTSGPALWWAVEYFGARSPRLRWKAPATSHLWHPASIVSLRLLRFILFHPFCFTSHLPKICCAGHALGRQLIRECATDFHAAKPHAVNFEGNIIHFWKKKIWSHLHEFASVYLSFKVRYKRVISAKQHDVKPSPATLLFAPTLGTFANWSFDGSWVALAKVATRVFITALFPVKQTCPKLQVCKTKQRCSRHWIWRQNIHQPMKQHHLGCSGWLGDRP